MLGKVVRWLATAYNPMQHFYKQSQEKGFNAEKTLKDVCDLLGKGQVSHLNYQSLLKGLNNYTYKASDTPEVWSSLKAHYLLYNAHFDEHTYALFLNTLYRKRYEDKAFIQEVLRSLEGRLGKMDAVGLGWIAEALAPYRQYVTQAQIDLFESRLIAIEDTMTPKSLQKLASSLYILQREFSVGEEVYRLCARLLLKWHRDLPLFQLAQCMNFLGLKDLTHDCDVYNVVQRYIAKELGEGRVTPRELVIFMNAFCSIYPPANFYAFFDRIEEEILLHPEDFLSKGIDFCTVIHSFSRMRRGQRIFALLPRFSSSLQSLESDPKSLGVTLSAILRAVPAATYRDEVIKPLLLRNAARLNSWHFKKCVLFLLKQSVEDEFFWKQVKALGLLALDERDRVHFAPVATQLKTVIGLDLSQP